jgi:hypothetical protein
MDIQPKSPVLIAGQSLQFHASTPWGTESTWSVLPASAGTISPTGLFTASVTPGTCMVLVVWSKDVRYAARTGVSILPAPPTEVISPHLVQAYGAQQSVSAGGLGNGAVVGEPIQATVATTANQSFRVRHGFDPPAQ